MSKKIAILGAGNGAFAMAGDLSLQGFEVAIWSSKKARLEAIWETKTIEVVGPTVQGQAKLALVTDHIGDAIRGADVICMPIPAFSQPEAAAALVPFIEDGQVIFLAPGSFGSFLMARKMRELGCFKEFAICETGTLPYLTRKTKPNESSIIVRACSLPTGVFPARLTGMAIEKLKKVVPTVHAVEDVLSGALMNAGPIIHPPLVVMNTGPIENQHSYDIHNEGTSAGIRLVQRDLDAERIILRKAFGYAPKHYPLDDYYNDGAEEEWVYPRESKKTPDVQQIVGRKGRLLPPVRNRGYRPWIGVHGFSGQLRGGRGLHCQLFAADRRDCSWRRFFENWKNPDIAGAW